MSNVYREFDTNAVLSKVSVKTVGLHDYEVITPEVARVVVTHTGDPRRDEFLTSVAKLFKGVAAPIVGSFKALTNRSAVGFVVANREVREYDAADSLKYRVVASNMLMDNEDETMWSLKEGAGGKYLARQCSDDLSELAHGVLARKSGQPTLASVVMASVDTKEFVSFINVADADLDYGHVVARTDDSLTVMSRAQDAEVTVDPRLVVHAVNLMGSDVEAFRTPITAATKEELVDYYRKAYKYSEDYIQKIIEMIDQHSFA